MNERGGFAPPMPRTNSWIEPRGAASFANKRKPMGSKFWNPLIIVFGYRLKIGASTNSATSQIGCRGWIRTTDVHQRGYVIYSHTCSAIYRNPTINWLSRQDSDLRMRVYQTRAVTRLGDWTMIVAGSESHAQHLCFLLRERYNAMVLCPSVMPH